MNKQIDVKLCPIPQCQAPMRKCGVLDYASPEVLSIQKAFAYAFHCDRCGFNAYVGNDEVDHKQ